MNQPDAREGSSADPAFDALVETLLRRLRSGETLDVESLAREHAGHADRIRSLVPVLALVERVKAAPAPTPGSDSARETAGSVADAPERVGRWRLRREIGRGGMGRVFDAVDDEGRRAAVKVIHAHLLAVPATAERFLREAEIGRRIDHPLVVHTLDAGRARVDGRETPWIALEHVEGRNLRQLLDERGSVGERLARAIGQRVAEALAAVHAAGLVHRDVKPENVLITPKEEVRLTDLGLALIRGAALRLSGTGDFVGTLLYAAPEQFHRNEIGPAVDLYALGLLLFELVAGRHPGAVVPPEPTVSSPAAPRLRDVADVSPFFDAVVAGLLEAAPERRLFDAQFVAGLLRDGEASAWWREREAGLHAARRIVVESQLPLVGREGEMARLDDAWASALRGDGHVVLVEADAGLGKSRLVHDWLERVERSGVAGLRTALAQHPRRAGDDDVLPLSAALRDVIGSGDLTARLEAVFHEPQLARSFAEALRGRSPPGSSSLPDASQATAHRLLLRGLAHDGPLIIVAEDLDKASDDSRRLFLTLARAAESTRVALVATAGPGLPATFLEALRGLPHAEVIGLDPLGRDDAHDLFLAAVGGAPTTAPWHDAVRGAGGNPLCLIEWARAAKAAPEGLASQPVPEVLRRLLQRRVGGLDAESAHLLAVAACAGERFDPSIVSVAAGTGRLEGLRRLHALDRTHRLVVADRDAYRFPHAVLRSVVYDDLPPALRAEIHGAIAKAIAEQATRGTTSGNSSDISSGARAAAFVHHALRSAQPRDALPRAEEAVEFLSTARRLRESAAVCEELIAMGALDRRLEAFAWIHLGSARIAFAPSDQVIPPLERGLALARALGDDDLLLLAALGLAAALGQAGRLEESLAHQRLGEECAARRGSPTGRVSAAIGLSAALFDLGRFAEAGESAATAAAIAREVRDPWSQANAAYFVGVVRLATGDPSGARPDLEVAVRAARALGDGGLETNTVTALSNADFIEGRLDAAREHLDRLVAIAREQGELRAELVTRVNLATLDASLGRLEEAREAASQALAAGRRAGFGAVAVHARTTLAWTDVLLGRWGDASRGYEETLAIAASMRSPVLEAKVAGRYLVLLAWSGRFEEGQALHVTHARLADEAGAARERLVLDDGLAELHLARGEVGPAATLLQKVVDESDRRRLLQEAVRASLVLGTCRRDLGDVDEARRLLDAARTTAARMGLRGVAALARVHLATLPGGDAADGREALADHGDAMGVHRRLCATAALASVTGDSSLRLAAQHDLERLLASLPEPARAAMRTRVPLHRAIDGPADPR